MPKGKKRTSVKTDVYLTKEQDEAIREPEPLPGEIPEDNFGVGDIYADMKIVEIKTSQERSIGFVYPVRGKTVAVKGGGSFFSPDALVTQPILNKRQEMIGESLLWDVGNIQWMTPKDFATEAKSRATRRMIPTELRGK